MLSRRVAPPDWRDRMNEKDGERVQTSSIIRNLRRGVQEREKSLERRGGIEPVSSLERVETRIEELEKKLEEADRKERKDLEKRIEELRERKMNLIAPRVTVPEESKGVERSSGKREGKKRAEEGIGLPETGTKKGMGDEEEEADVTRVNEYYSLVPRNPRQGEDIFAYAHIVWDEEEGSLIYNIVEPSLSERDEELVGDIKRVLEEKLDVDFGEIGKIEAESYLRNEVDETIDSLERNLNDEEKKAVKYYLERDFLGLGKIEPFMRDPHIEDISCDGVGVPVYVWHRNPHYGSMETNIKFTDGDELDSFTRKLVQKAGKTISMADPLVDAALPDGSRLQATLGTDIARRGSNFTIRKFTENPLTPVDLIEFGTIDPRTLAYLWFLVESQKSILITGGTATGKTTMLNVISLFIRPQMKIVTIEDSIGGDTDFLYRNAGELHQGKVGSYIDKQIESNGYRLPSGHEVAENLTGLRVPTINNQGKLKLSRPTALIRHKVNKEIYKIKTNTGKQIETTGDHSLYILGPDPEKMSPGKFLEAVIEGKSKEKPWNEKMEVDLENYRGVLEKKGYREITGDEYKSRKSSIRRKVKITREFVKLLGFIVARGIPEPERKSLSLPSSDEEMNSIVREQSKKIGFKLHEGKERNQEITSSTFYCALKALGLELEEENLSRRTPGWTTQLPQELKEAFVEGLKRGNQRPIYSLRPKLCKARVSKLEPGDWIITTRKMPSGEGVEEVDLKEELGEGGIKEEDEEVRMGENSLPRKVELDEKLLEFIGLWVADGCYDESGKYVIQSAPARETREIVKDIADRYNLTVKDHSDGFSQNVYGKIFYLLMKDVLNLKQGAEKKRFPEWAFRLDRKQTAAILRGYFSGDNDDTAHELGAASVNNKLLKQVQTLLLRFGIRSNLIQKKDHYSLRISGIRNLKKMEEIGFVREDRKKRFEEIMNGEESNHDKQDLIDLPRPFLWKLIDQSANLVGEEWTYETWKSRKGRYRKSKPGRNFLKKLLEKGNLDEETREDLKKILEGDYRFEEVRKMEKDEKEKMVYDFSVPPEERFIAGNILCSNTPELRLPHEHWVPEVARESITERGETGVDMYRLLKESLRQRPDYITVGEVRGKEAFVLFQQIATGHAGLSTIHSENLERLVDRLTTQPINLPPSLIENLDAIVFLKKVQSDEGTMRRINEILEMENYEKGARKPVVNQMFRWDSKEDKLKVEAKSTLLEKIADEKGMEEDEIVEDLKDRIKVVEWMVEKSIRNLDSINRIIEMYYTNKQRLMERIELSGS